MKQPKETAYYPSMIKDIADQSEILTDKEVSRKLANLAYKIDSEAAVNEVHKMEYRRVK